MVSLDSIAVSYRTTVCCYLGTLLVLATPPTIYCRFSFDSMGPLMADTKKYSPSTILQLSYHCSARSFSRTINRIVRTDAGLCFWASWFQWKSCEIRVQAFPIECYSKLIHTNYLYLRIIMVFEVHWRWRLIREDRNENTWPSKLPEAIWQAVLEHPR